MAESRLAYEGDVFGALAHVEAAEKILILHRNPVPVAVVFEILQVGLDQRMHMAHLGHEQMLPLDNAVEHVVESNRGRR
jgi:hypothetical protein